jgi:O-antigen/teichoic acid export membrane protein
VEKDISQLRRVKSALRLRTIARITRVLLLRGFGSGLAVLFTLSVTRHLETSDAARFLLIFNITTVAAVCFRWGLDALIVRIVATLPAAEAGDPIRRLMRIAHRRVGIWMVVSAAVAAGIALAPNSSALLLTPRELVIAVVVSALLALTACAGQVQRGLGRVDYAAFILTMMVPAFLLPIFLLLINLDFAVNAWNLSLLYAAVALVSYLGLVWASPITRPYRYHSEGKRPNRSGDEKVERQAANRLGGIVLSQQALNWSALLLVPIAYGDRLFNSFMVTYKVALLITLVMVAVNFTFVSRLAELFAAKELQQLQRLTKAMVIVVASSCVIAATVVFFARGTIYAFAGVDRLDGALALLVVSQALFAVAAVYSQVLNMCGDEVFVLSAHICLVSAGVICFAILSFKAPLEVACGVFTVTYLGLAEVLRRRVRKVTEHREGSTRFDHGEGPPRA